MTAQIQPPLPPALAHAHPQAAEAMQQLQRFQSVLEGVADQIGNETFTGTDEDKTIEVTVNGQHVLTALHIEDGLLRLGAKTVERRANEALRNAQAAATAAVSAQHEQLYTNLADIANELKTGLGLDQRQP